jgi:hypothetical protein
MKAQMVMRGRGNSLRIDSDAHNNPGDNMEYRGAPNSSYPIECFTVA